MRLALAHTDKQPATSVSSALSYSSVTVVPPQTNRHGGVVSSTEPCLGGRAEDVTRELHRCGGLRDTDLRVCTKGTAVNETMAGRAAEAAGEAGFLSPPASFFENHLHSFF